MSDSTPFSFDFALTVEKLTNPAKEGADALGRMVRQLRAVAREIERVDPLLSKAGGRMLQFEAQSARALRTTEQAALRLKEALSGLNQATGLARIARDMERANRAAEDSRHKAAGSPWLGGHSSLRSLLAKTAESKISGFTSGLASKIIGGPASLAMGGIGLAGDALSFGADLASSAADAAVSFGKMAISAQAMREQSVEGFKAVYGSAEVSEKLFDRAVQIAKQTKFDTPQVVGAFNTLAANRFTADELPKMFDAYADVASMRGEGKGRQFMRGLGSLRSSPYAGWGAFKQAAEGGPGVSNALDALADSLGMEKTGNVKRRLMKLMRTDQIGSDAALNAILTAVQRTYDRDEKGGLNKLGTAAVKQGEGTWEGLLSNIKTGLDDVLTMKLPPDHPMLRFKDVLKSVNSIFGGETENAKKFQQIVSNLVRDVFLIFNIDTKKSEGFMGSILKVADIAEDRLHSLALWINEHITKPIFDAISGPGPNWVMMNEDQPNEMAKRLKSALADAVIDVGFMAGKAFISGIWEVMKAVAPAIGKHLSEAYWSAQRRIWTAPVPIIEQMEKARIAPKGTAAYVQDLHPVDWLWGKVGGLASAGADQMKGLAKGMQQATPEVTSTATQAAAAAEEAVRAKTETRSPSRMFARIGEGWGDGLSLGIESRRAAVQMSMTSLVPAAGGGGPTVNFYGDIVIDGASKSGSELADELLGALMSRIGGQVRTPNSGTLR